MKNKIYVFAVFGLITVFLNTAYAKPNFINHEENNEVYATLVPNDEATLSSELSGRIEKIYFSPGERFKQGDTLIKFDCESTEIEKQKLSAKLQGAETKLKSFERLKALDSASDVEYADALSERNQAKAELALADYKLKNCVIKAPYSGEVISKQANDNEYIKEGSPLLYIVGHTNLEVQIYIPSLWLHWIKVGSPFTLTLQEADKTLHGNVTKIVGSIDSASQSLLIYGKLQSNNDLLFPGMSGIAKFDRPPKKI